MPEYIILISAIICVGSAVGYYFNRAHAAPLAAAIISFIGLLYGIAQYIERDNTEARTLGFADAADRRSARDAGFDDGEKWKRAKAFPEVRVGAQKPEEARAVEVKAAPPQTKTEADQLDSYGPVQPAGQGAQDVQLGVVSISNLTSRKGANKFVEVSGTVSNRNPFAIKNVVIRCGDKSYASGDVTAVVDNVIPAKSDLKISGLWMGPILPHLPPTACVVAKFDKAD
jgi:hypothetical protein